MMTTPHGLRVWQ